ncbi:MAG: mechanosensitive ion channel family protein [bacterium]|nr:mechanosensitive ion channel family protein [bacterium]
MDVQQSCNLQLKEKIEKEGIEFAFPTQTILMRKEQEK